MKSHPSTKIPKGFVFSAAEAAVKKPGRNDVALILSDVVANMAGTFTTNSVKAAPVRICMKKIKSGKGQVIFVNSGNANACTGKQGIKDANDIIDGVSRSLGIKSSLVYICSTGVIGTPMPMERIIPSLDKLAGNVGKCSLSDVASAIMTTDTFPKILHREIYIGNMAGTISGICKGAGMIAPDMATMLCFIITDVAVERNTMLSMLRNSVRKSFNRITVDGDMSTNDTVLMMSNGMLGNRPITVNSKYFNHFRKGLDEITYGLSRLVVRDGEGATKIVEVFVKGAKSETDAEKAAFAIANSNLVKTAIYGNDANWGRIMAALGCSGIRFVEGKTDIHFNNIKVVRNGISCNKDEEAAGALRSKEIKITIDLHAGGASARVLTCDLTEEYVRVNAEYRS
ncbi:MAG: bifunctional glutamate N-acetyltransferase/amino-acid acetyltransferase ArgJ [Nitrospirota bacterium]